MANDTQFWISYGMDLKRQKYWNDNLRGEETNSKSDCIRGEQKV